MTNGRHRSSRAQLRKRPKAVGWLTRAGSGEALLAWGIVIIIIGGFVTVFTPVGYVPFGIGFVMCCVGMWTGVR